MKTIVWCVLALVLIACSNPSSAPPVSRTETAEPVAIETSTAVPSQTPVPAPEPAERGTAAPQAPPSEANITIREVELANPLTIAGTARTFENNVALRARNARGEVIAESFTTATGEMGQHNPYRGTLWLTRVPGDRIIIEALEYSARDGSEQSVVRVERPFSVANVEVSLYLPDAQCTRVEKRAHTMPKSVAMARLLVEALMRAPGTPFPKGSRVESVNLKNGVVTVDFNERLQNVGGSCAAQMIRQSVTQTLRQLPSVREVVIKAGGSERLALQP